MRAVRPCHTATSHFSPHAVCLHRPSITHRARQRISGAAGAPAGASVHSVADSRASCRRADERGWPSRKPRASRRVSAACAAPASWLPPLARGSAPPPERAGSTPQASTARQATAVRSGGRAPHRSTAHASARAGARVPRRRVCAHGRGRAQVRLGRAHAERSSHSSAVASAHTATPPGSRHKPGA